MLVSVAYVCLLPVVFVLQGRYTKKEKFTRNQLVGAVVGFVGLMLLKISQNM